MTETTIREAFRSAQLVRMHDTRDVAVVWRGGHTFNIYSFAGEGIRETTCHTVHDKDGEPPAAAKAEEHAADLLAEIDN